MCGHIVPLRRAWTIDVDHFESCNDDLGHQAGDAVLAGLASILLVQARLGDVAARYGAEEFALILPPAGPGDARQVVERLRSAMREATWPGRPVTASIGVATLSSDIEVDDLIAAADDALYDAKESGRDRCVVRRPADRRGGLDPPRRSLAPSGASQ